MSEQQMATLTGKTVENIRRRYIMEEKIDAVDPFKDPNDKKPFNLIVCNNKLLQVLDTMEKKEQRAGKKCNYVNDAQLNFQFLKDEQSIN